MNESRYADSFHCGRAAHSASLDVSSGTSDASFSGDDSGALDALWRFEDAHHFVLTQQLAFSHAAFVRDLYAALEKVRDAVEQQSVHVLAVLHDKDVRIQALEEKVVETMKAARVDVGVQVMGMRRKHQATQSEDRGDAVEKLQRRVSEQEEQIEVLLDELERLQQVVKENKERAWHDQADRNDAKATQTDMAEDENKTTEQRRAGQAMAAIAALQRQLDSVEQSNAELRQALEAKQQHDQVDDTEPCDAIESELRGAIRRMEAASRCRVVAPLMSSDEERMPCLDLEHRLQAADLEREALENEIVALRAALTGNNISQFSSGELVRVQAYRAAKENTGGSSCRQVTCCHTLRWILRHLQSQRGSQREQNVEVLVKEMRRAWRGRNENEVAAIVARIGAEWMQWDAAHVEEVDTLRRAHAEQLEVRSARVSALVDEIHRLKQQDVGLQTELRVLSSQREQTASQDTVFNEVSVSDPTLVDLDRRVLVLEQQLLLKQEQLDVANRAIRAMSELGPRPNGVQLLGQGVSTQLSRKSHERTAVSWHNQVAQLSAELQLAKEKAFKRFCPADSSQTSLVEYFRVEKECLHLRHRLKEKDERIQQLEMHCQQSEAVARRARTRDDIHEVREAVKGVIAMHTDTINASKSTRDLIEHYYLRILEKRSEDLQQELSKARSRIVFLEREIEKTEQDDMRNQGTSLLREIAQQIEAHHRRAIASFHTWQQKFQNDKGLAPADGCVADATGFQPNTMQHLCHVVLGHYETLSLQLRVLRTEHSSLTMPLISEQSSLTRHWHLLEHIHVLEDQLLESQVCLNCGDPIVKKRAAKKMNVGTETESRTTVDATTQVRSRDQQHTAMSIGIQVGSTTPPFQAEESPGQPSQHHEDQHDLASTATRGATMVNDGQSRALDDRLHQIQQQLDSSLARIDELTAQKEKLKASLEEAKRVNRQQLKEHDNLRLQVAEMSNSNTSLSNQLQRYRQTAGNAETFATEGEMVANSGSSKGMLAVKEQENAELVRQLCEAKEKCFQAERCCENAQQQADKLNEQLKSLHATSMEDRNRHLEEYMARVNQSLHSIEHEKEKLARDNQALTQKLQQIELDMKTKEAKGSRTCGTETDGGLDLDRLVRLPEYQDLETRVIMLQTELEAERQKCEGMRAERDAEQSERDRALDAQLSKIDNEKASLRRLIEELRASHELLQREFVELQTSSLEAKEEAEKRIQFLTACVEECSRIVDSAGPNDDVVTSRDIYDTIVTLSKKASVASLTSSTPTSRKSKSPPTAKSHEKKTNAKSSSETTLSTVIHEHDLGVQLHTQIQAETWRIQAAKLESSLRAVRLKNKTFEDMVGHLEIQMDGLREEVKDRMGKESMLLAKQGQAKVEITNLKAQNATLTSRLAEACGELKRTQEGSKATEEELTRLRSALQRKSELLTRQKTKCDDTQQALDHAVKRVSQLEVAEKNLAMAQAKQKDLSAQLQDVRQQFSVSRDASVEFRAHVDKLKEQVGELQSRVKALRLDNGLLRDQLRELKKTMREEAETAFKLHASDIATAAAAVLGDGKPPQKLTPTAAVNMLTSQVKTLKRRVLQKQEVIIAYKTKLSELDAELTLQRTKVFELSQAYRQSQQTQRDKELSMVQGATQLKEDLKQALATKAEQLDGLRASIFDACEVFVHCQPRKSALDSPHESRSSSASPTWPDDTDDELRLHGDSDVLLLQELRRYADLSPADLADLRITSPRQSQQKQRLDREYTAEKEKQRGERVLQELERALEATPHDCRHEICRVLELLTRRPPARRC